jgi:hypothetical protein
MPPQGGQRPRSHRAASERRAWAETIVRAEVRGKEIYEHLRQEIRAFPAEFLLFFPVAAVLRSMMANSPHEYSGSNPIAFSAFCTTVEELPSGARLLKEETERLAQLPEPWEGLEFATCSRASTGGSQGSEDITLGHAVSGVPTATRETAISFSAQRASGLAQNRR